MYPTLFATSGVKDFAEAVDAERQAQLAKWGDQRHPDGTSITEDAVRAAEPLAYVTDVAEIRFDRVTVQRDRFSLHDLAQLDTAGDPK